MCFFVRSVNKGENMMVALTELLKQILGDFVDRAVKGRLRRQIPSSGVDNPSAVYCVAIIVKSILNDVTSIGL